MRENILPASVPVTLDDQVYTLRYRAYAFIFYAEHCGGDLLADLRDVAEAMQKAQETQGAGIGTAFGKLRDMLWAGLVDAQPEITRDQVARMFGFSDLQNLMPVMSQALYKGLPQAEPPAAARPMQPEPGHDLESSNGRVSGQPSEILAVSGV
jgi:hypothetical protein